jgi:F-type H+-transporting ATPase subunit b
MNINATLIGQAISFIIFVWFTMKYVWTPISAALEERKAEEEDR